MSRHVSLAAAAVAAASLVATGACGQNGAGPVPVPPASNDFGTTSLIGATVTVSGWVTQVLSESSFVVDTRQNGNEPLLVLCAPSRDVSTGSLVIVSGNVQKFEYASYADEYELAPDADAYDRFTGDPFLVTTNAMRLQ